MMSWIDGQNVSTYIILALAYALTSMQLVYPAL